MIEVFRENNYEAIVKISGNPKCQVLLHLILRYILTSLPSELFKTVTYHDLFS